LLFQHRTQQEDGENKFLANLSMLRVGDFKIQDKHETGEAKSLASLFMLTVCDFTKGLKKKMEKTCH
jgi:hypothetical protein